MDSDATLGGSGSPQHGRRTRAILPRSLQRQRFQTRGWFPIQGRYTLFGTGVRRKRSLHLLSRYSSLHDCETRDSWAGHELHSSPTPLEIRVTPGYSHWRASGRHPRSSIERAACALGRFLGRRRSQWAAPAFGSREEQSRADLQSSRSGTISQAAAINRTCALSRCGYGQWRRSSPGADLPHFVLLGVVTGLGFLQAETFPFFSSAEILLDRPSGLSSFYPLYLHSCDCRFQRPIS
jgi:hypothetical protein